jgi:branched-chain amino acid transport system permease protein
MTKTIHKLKQLLQDSYPFRFVVFGIILSIIPLFAEIGIMQNSTVRLLGYVIIFTVVALGLNLLLGFSGLVSLGTAGFMGFGAYLFVFISNNVFDGFIIAMVLTLVVAGLIGALIGLLSLKVEGIYLAIATLFIGEIFLQIFRNVDWFTGGFSGMRHHHPMFNLLFTEITLTRNLTYVLMVVILVLVMIAMYHLIHSRTGRALMAMSRSEHAAQAMGISILKYRLIAFVTATVLATLGGVLYISYFRFVDPSPWNLNRSLFIIAMVVVGGYKSIFGTALGAFIIHGVPELYLKDIFSGNPEFSYIFAGVLIIVVIMFYPNGTIYIGHDVKMLYYKYIYPRRLPFITLKKVYKLKKSQLENDKSNPTSLQNIKDEYHTNRQLLKQQIKERLIAAKEKYAKESLEIRKLYKDKQEKLQQSSPTPTEIQLLKKHRKEELETRKTLYKKEKYEVYRNVVAELMVKYSE